MIAVCSIFRNSIQYLDRYFRQINTLRAQLDEDVRLVLAEGDSTDFTWDSLTDYLQEGDVAIQAHHGGPHFGSVDHPQRWQQIAQVVQSVVPLALGLHPDVVVWVESDLVWDYRVLQKMIETAHQGHSVAPMVFAGDTERFYDIWGYRMGGLQFTPHQPYLPKEGEREGGLVKIDSCGSCFATTNVKALREWTGHWPFTCGGGLWLDPMIAVRHP